MLKLSLGLLAILGTGFLLGGLSGNVVSFALIYGLLYVLVAFPLSNIIPFRLTGLKMSSLSDAVLRPLLAACCAAGVSWWVGYYTSELSGIARLVLAVAVGCASYLALIQRFSGRTIAQNKDYCLELLKEARR